MELVPDRHRIGTIAALDLYDELGVRWLGSKRSSKQLARLACCTTRAR